MVFRLHVIALTGFFAFGPRLLAADLIPPASVSISGISVQVDPQQKLSATYALTISKARARAGWQLTTGVGGGQIVHGGSSFAIPSTVRFTAIQGLNGASTAGISISPDGTTITSGSYNATRSYQASFHAQLNVPALPRAGAYSGTISFIITEY